MEGAIVERPVMIRIGDDAPDFEAVTTHGKKKRMSEGYECVDWFLCKKKLPER